MIIGLAGYTFRNGDINYNMMQMERAINECHKDVDLLCFGESFLQGFDALSWEYEKDKDIAVSKDSDIMNELKEMSRMYHKDLAFGYIEKDDDKLYSSYAVIASGELVRNYRRVTKNWKEYTKTDEHYCEGTDTSSFLYKGVPVTIALCGDLWICPEKFVTDGLLLWPVYLGYTKEQWKTEKDEYAKQAVQVSRHTLLVNSISRNPKSVGGAMHFYDGMVAEKLPFGKEGILEVNITFDDVIDLKEFLDTYDTMCREGKSDQLEGYLIDGMEQATKKGNLPVVFTIANELLGYYRVNGRTQECLDCIDTVMFLAKLLGIEGSHQYAVTMINVATAYRVCKDYNQSLTCYQKAAKLLQEPTYERASLLNNMSLLYIDIKEFAKAEDCLLEAFDILSETVRVEEMATTKVNIGNLCYYRGKFFRGLRYMEEALHLYEQPENRSVHYASALSGIAEGYFHIKEYETSLKYYDQCLAELYRVYGKNAEYEKILKNRDLAERMVNRQNELWPMEKIRQFVEENFLPVLKEKYGEYPVAVGLVGEGSQCYGYDDKYSVDHDYGMGFCVWMSEETYRKVGTQLQKEYERITEPYRRNTTEEGQGRVGVMTVDSFIQRISEVYPESEKEWMTIKEEQLSAMTNGEIFYDPCDVITSKIHAIRKYPENIKMKKLAVSLHEMAQSGQYNYLRCYKRKDKGAMLLVKQAFVDATIQTAYLLNDRYKPFYKWTFRKMEEFTVLKDIPDLLVKLMETDVWDTEAFERIEEICESVAKETEKLGFTLNHSFLDGYSRQIAEKYHG